MRLHRDQSQPYSDRDLKREFPGYVIEPVDDPVLGRRWSGNRVGFPAILAIVEDTPAGLAVKLREEQDVITEMKRHAQMPP